MTLSFTRGHFTYFKAFLDAIYRSGLSVYSVMLMLLTRYAFAIANYFATTETETVTL